ncbi:MAG: hypothetical protein PHE68_00190 [Candidatus Peribacteraceae bacterium]|nr:hypothetical protein [Candidatus Peribacteraceae bacterium]MDD5074772.1 hypothetical protein [Candidatus Peribacteraceae bacterium]
MNSPETINGIPGQPPVPNYVVPQGVEQLSEFVGIDPRGVILIDPGEESEFCNQALIQARIHIFLRTVTERLLEGQRARVGVLAHGDTSGTSAAMHDLPPSYIVPEGTQQLPGFLGIDPGGVILIDGGAESRYYNRREKGEIQTRIETCMNAVITRLNEWQRARVGVVTRRGTDISVATHDLHPFTEMTEIDENPWGDDIGIRYDVRQLIDAERARFVLWAANADRDSLSRLAVARRSSAWGSGGREVTPPSQVNIDSVSATELVEAMIWEYVRERRNEIVRTALSQAHSHEHAA